MVRTASPVPMGAQRYEQEIISRAFEALAATGQPDWKVRELVIRSLRSPLRGDRRVPQKWITGASPAARAALGRVLYPRHDVCHRMGLDLPPSAGKDVVTVHDLVAWRFPDEAPRVSAAATELRRAAAVITVSEFSAGEAEEVLGIPRPYVVPNGVDEAFFDAPPATDEVLARIGVRPPFVLCAGGSSLRKNLASLAEAWPTIHRARPELSLVLSGPESQRRSALFASLAGTVLSGRLPDRIMPSLVSAASCLVVPSVYEGFGLPALEGMAAGTPVVAARASSLPEVVGDGGLLVEPSKDGLIEGVLAVVEGSKEIVDLVVRGRQRAAQFTWERSALAHARIWGTLIRGS
jgi:glycosyltransferase involved in cell wall biosynthesis